MNFVNKIKSNKAVIILIAIFILGIVLRFENISPFKLYPDTYQNLLVAKNVQTYGGVTGFLGKNGLFFPPFVAWSRPFYALLIVSADFFIHNLSTSAQLIAFVCGILSIPISFLLAKKIFNSNAIGLSAAFLLAISFNHTVWSGIIMTEATAFFVMLLFLLSLIWNLKKKSNFFNVWDLITGAFLAAAVLTRYEYSLVLAPTIYLLFQAPNPIKKGINIFAAFIFVIALVLYLFFPWQGFVEIILFQILSYIQKLSLWILVVIILFSLIFLFRQKINFNLLVKLFSYLTIILFAAILILFYIFKVSLFPSFVSFARDDFLIVISFLVGVYFLSKEKKHFTVLIFSLFSIFLFTPAYRQINPGMERYWTHIIPFFLIPASFGFYKLCEFAFVQLKKGTNKNLAALLLISIIFSSGFQIYKTFYGFKVWGNGSLGRTSYEEKAAVKTIPNLKGDNILIVSEPEPYYYFTHISTQSINDNYPYVYIDDRLNNKTIIIVEDMGMYHFFPNFTKFINKNLRPYQIKSFYVNEVYHAANLTYREIYPVVLYKLTLNQLKNEIKKSKTHK